MPFLGLPRPMWIQKSVSALRWLLLLEKQRKAEANNMYIYRERCSSFVSKSNVDPEERQCIAMFASDHKLLCSQECIKTVEIQRSSSGKCIIRMWPRGEWLCFLLGRKRGRTAKKSGLLALQVHHLLLTVHLDDERHYQHQKRRACDPCRLTRAPH